MFSDFKTGVEHAKTWYGSRFNALLHGFVKNSGQTAAQLYTQRRYKVNIIEQ